MRNIGKAVTLRVRVSQRSLWGKDKKRHEVFLKGILDCLGVLLYSIHLKAFLGKDKGSQEEKYGTGYDAFLFACYLVLPLLVEQHGQNG